MCPVCLSIPGRIHRHFSDDNRYIIQQETGIVYEYAEDITPCPYTYVEGDYFEWYIVFHCTYIIIFPFIVIIKY